MVLYSLKKKITEKKKKESKIQRPKATLISSFLYVEAIFFFLKSLTHMPLAMNYGFSKFPCAVTCIVHQLLFNINTKE